MSEWIKGTLTKEDIATWLKQNLNKRDILILKGLPYGTDKKYEENFEHLLDCLWSIYNWYTKNWQPGHFLSAILRNDFMEATGRADDINVKMLDIYAKFLYNEVPGDYKEKI